MFGGRREVSQQLRCSGPICFDLGVQCKMPPLGGTTSFCKPCGFRTHPCLWPKQARKRSQGTVMGEQQPRAAWGFLCSWGLMGPVSGWQGGCRDMAATSPITEPAEESQAEKPRLSRLLPSLPFTKLPLWAPHAHEEPNHPHSRDALGLTVPDLPWSPGTAPSPSLGYLPNPHPRMAEGVSEAGIVFPTVWSQTVWIQSQALPLSTCIVLGKLLNFCEPQSFHL